MSQAEAKNTPLMEQYFSIKEQYPDMLLFFQVGDFYELFFDDAKRAAEFLAITLTKRGKNKGEDIPLCGIPVHALNHYLKKLINGGFTVALCNQLEKPQPGAVVKRGVTHLFTPGTLTDQQFLHEKSASYLLTCFPAADKWALVFTELLTAQVFATTIPAHNMITLEAELARFIPEEVVVLASQTTLVQYFKKQGYYVTALDGAQIVQQQAESWRQQQFSTKVQAALAAAPELVGAVTTLYAYLVKYQPGALPQVKNIQFYAYDDFLILDPATQKNLEILANQQDHGRSNSLLSVLDCARTAMGSRTIKKWLQRPLVDKHAIMQRQELVGQFVHAVGLQQELEGCLAQMPDLERIVGRIGLQRATLADYCALNKALALAQQLHAVLQVITVNELGQLLYEKIVFLPELQELLRASLNDDADNAYYIKPGFDLQLDYLRSLVTDSQQALIKLEQQEIERTGINSLKVRYNGISGYYIEITNTHAALVPADYQHVQTLVSRKRFVTKALQDLERDIMKAHQEINGLEQEVFDRIKQEVVTHLTVLRQLAYAIAYSDALFGFARAAYQNRYVAPSFNDSGLLAISEGRHPVVEQHVGRAFIPNDTMLDQQATMLLITGPNMGGKSTYLRQVPVLCIMAQCGSYVPAREATLPLLDRIFTRIGSGDNVAEGKSTFLVEMEEAALICTQATARSLVILDEVGRGTSTFDGMALAQAIVEHIVTQVRAKCLFATHYHELTQLAEANSHIKNYYMVCYKKGHVLHFTHRLEQGVAGQSFGLEVARLAQLPESIVNRAADRLLQLRSSQVAGGDLEQDISTRPSESAMHFAASSVYKQLLDLDVDLITPRQALDIVAHLKSLCE